MLAVGAGRPSRGGTPRRAQGDCLDSGRRDGLPETSMDGAHQERLARFQSRMPRGGRARFAAFATSARAAVPTRCCPGRPSGRSPPRTTTRPRRSPPSTASPRIPRSTRARRSRSRPRTRAPRRSRPPVPRPPPPEPPRLRDLPHGAARRKPVVGRRRQRRLARHACGGQRPVSGRASHLRAEIRSRRERTASTTSSTPTSSSPRPSRPRRTVLDLADLLPVLRLGRDLPGVERGGQLERDAPGVAEHYGIDLYPAGPYSAYRSYAQQLYLYNLYLSGEGSLAAAPGTSSHEYGYALDLADPSMRTVIDQIGPTTAGERRRPRASGGT